MRWLVGVVVLVAGARADSDFAVYDREAIGPLHAKMTDAELVKVLGKPGLVEKPVQEAARGQWVSAWAWKDSRALLVSDTGKPPWRARDVSTSHAGWATKKKIQIGSTRRDVEKAYPRDKDAPPPQDPDAYLVGSPYSGMLIRFASDRVTTISIGVFAF